MLWIITLWLEEKQRLCMLYHVLHNKLLPLYMMALTGNLNNTTAIPRMALILRVRQVPWHACQALHARTWRCILVHAMTGRGVLR